MRFSHKFGADGRWFDVAWKEHDQFLKTGQLFWSPRYRRDNQGITRDIHNIPITPDMGIYPITQAYCDGWEQGMKIELSLQSKYN